MAVTVTIYGKEYDTEKDFSWAELMLIEEIGGQPLGDERSWQSMAVLAATVFTLLKREDAVLTWEKFVEMPMHITDNRDDAPAKKPAVKKPAAKARPTRRAKART